MKTRKWLVLVLAMLAAIIVVPMAIAQGGHPDPSWVRQFVQPLAQVDWQTCPGEDAASCATWIMPEGGNPITMEVVMCSQEGTRLGDDGSTKYDMPVGTQIVFGITVRSCSTDDPGDGVRPHPDPSWVSSWVDTEESVSWHTCPNEAPETCAAWDERDYFPHHAVYMTVMRVPQEGWRKVGEYGVEGLPVGRHLVSGITVRQDIGTPVHRNPSWVIRFVEVLDGASLEWHECPDEAPDSCAYWYSGNHGPNRYVRMRIARIPQDGTRLVGGVQVLGLPLGEHLVIGITARRTANWLLPLVVRD